MTKVVLLAGGKGSRLNDPNPKPLVRIGNIPLVQHVMNTYNYYGYNQFILATGYRHEEFEKYFSNADLPYFVTLMNTGENTDTGERIRKVKPLVKNEVFCLSYSDGLSDVNLKEIESSFLKTNADIIITTIHPPERYGLISLSEDVSEISRIKNFNEKPKRTDWINGGFMVCRPTVFDYIDENDIFEQISIPKIIDKGIALAYKYSGNWGCVDTQKDLNTFIDLWDNDKAFWKNRGEID